MLFLIGWLIINPRHCLAQVACCYRSSSIVVLSPCPSVCQSVGNELILWKNGRLDWDAVLGLGLGRFKEPCSDPREKGQILGNKAAQCNVRGECHWHVFLYNTLGMRLFPKLIWSLLFTLGVWWNAVDCVCGWWSKCAICDCLAVCVCVCTVRWILPTLLLTTCSTRYWVHVTLLTRLHRRRHCQQMAPRCLYPPSPQVHRPSITSSLLATIDFIHLFVIV